MPEFSKSSDTVYFLHYMCISSLGWPAVGCLGTSAACSGLRPARGFLKRGVRAEDQLERADAGSWQIADRYYTAS